MLNGVVLSKYNPNDIAVKAVYRGGRISQPLHLRSSSTPIHLLSQIPAIRITQSTKTEAALCRAPNSNCGIDLEQLSRAQISIFVKISCGGRKVATAVVIVKYVPVAKMAMVSALVKVLSLLR